MTQVNNQAPMRLQKFLARAGVASRRASEQLILEGAISINGVTVTELGTKVIPEQDQVCVHNQPVTLANKQVYIMLYKPAGYITTMDDPHQRKCVEQLVPTDKYPALFPVGRLDRDTTGLLLFTTDGEIGYTCLHPKHHVNKHYIALVKGKLTEKKLDKLRMGIELSDGMCQPAEAQMLSFDNPRAACVLDVIAYPSKNSIVSLTIHEGKNRQVKRMLEQVGNPVVRLHRDTFGPLSLSNIELGEWRYLTDDEIVALKNATS